MQNEHAAPDRAHTAIAAGMPETAPAVANASATPLDIPISSRPEMSGMAA